MTKGGLFHQIYNISNNRYLYIIYFNRIFLATAKEDGNYMTELIVLPHQWLQNSLKGSEKSITSA